jgi:small subunit ribosomal protein S16
MKFMVRIRLSRVGSKRQPSYRVVAINREAPRDSKALEILGYYNPRTTPETITLNEARIYEWMKNGAQPSESMLQVFKSAGLMGRYERFQKGESIETLATEAKAAETARNINPKTTKLGN